MNSGISVCRCIDNWVIRKRQQTVWISLRRHPPIKIIALSTEQGPTTICREVSLRTEVWISRILFPGKFCEWIQLISTSQRYFSDPCRRTFTHTVIKYQSTASTERYLIWGNYGSYKIYIKISYPFACMALLEIFWAGDQCGPHTRLHTRVWPGFTECKQSQRICQKSLAGYR